MYEYVNMKMQLTNSSGKLNLEVIFLNFKHILNVNIRNNASLNIGTIIIFILSCL